MNKQTRALYDENILSDTVHWLKCGVCNEKWSVSIKNNKIVPEENIENTSLTNDYDFDNDTNKVKNELASIKLVVETKSKQMSNLNNPILELKNKSVAEIAAELSASKLKINNLNLTEPLKQTKNSNQSDKSNIKKSTFFPLMVVLLFLIIGSSLFFRSPILGYSYLYFPGLTEKYEEKINIFFNFIKLPILAELNHIKIADFGATFQKNDVKFFGFLENSSLRPILVPKIKVLAVTEDGKILIEKIIPMTKKVIVPSSKIKFFDIVNMNFKKENVSVRVIILKEISIY